jgi:uncharacterized protein YjbI with pentapeptide repeats
MQGVHMAVEKVYLGKEDPKSMMTHNVVVKDAGNITKEECIALARAGKDSWNQWRNEFGVRQAPSCSVFSLENCADFSDCDLAGIDFRGFIFGDGANFCGAYSSDPVSFGDASFGKATNFDWARFEESTSFKRVTFGNGASFIGTQFRIAVSFEYATFDGDVDFSGREWHECRQNNREKLESRSNKIGASPTAFPLALFSGAKFNGQTFFNYRKFVDAAVFGSDSYPEGESFSAAAFRYAPRFHNCTFSHGANFDDVEFPAATGDLNAARAYRTLKLAFAQQQATREEQRFFKLEMAEEAKHFANKKCCAISRLGYTASFQILALAWCAHCCGCWLQWESSLVCLVTPQICNCVTH